jgi:hypothetical protein
MTRITTLAHLAASKEPPPPGVWNMTMTVLGAFFGAPSSKLRSARRLPEAKKGEGR